jgi:hypothetical protein
MLLVANMSLANLIFGLNLAKPTCYLAIAVSTNFQPKLMLFAVTGHSTISVDAEPYHVIHMGPMNGFVMRNMLLVANLSHMPISFSGLIRSNLGKLSAPIFSLS